MREGQTPASRLECAFISLQGHRLIPLIRSFSFLQHFVYWSERLDAGTYIIVNFLIFRNFKLKLHSKQAIKHGQFFYYVQIFSNRKDAALLKL